MGLMSAYYASKRGLKVIVLERSTISNKESASAGLTRSRRQDYLDPYYANLAYESRNLWLELESLSDKKFVIECGCLNLAKKELSPKLNSTYAAQAGKVLQEIGFKNSVLDRSSLAKRFPQFNSDLGVLDEEAGFIYVPEVFKLLKELLKKQKVEIRENFIINKIEEKSNEVIISTKQNKIFANKLIIATGRWINETISMISDINGFQFPIFLDKPMECKYFIPKNKTEFNYKNLPVFAYLDFGIYGHPIYNDKTLGVKIGYFNPSDFSVKTGINSIDDFVRECMPSLKGAKSIPVSDYDQGFYTFVKDDEFILGNLPNYKKIFVGSGWRGTGFKFATLIGKSLSELVIDGKTKNNLRRFNPKRFV